MNNLSVQLRADTSACSNVSRVTLCQLKCHDISGRNIVICRCQFEIKSPITVGNGAVEDVWNRQYLCVGSIVRPAGYSQRGRDRVPRKRVERPGIYGDVMVS